MPNLTQLISKDGNDLSNLNAGMEEIQENINKLLDDMDDIEGANCTDVKNLKTKCEDLIRQGMAGLAGVTNDLQEILYSFQNGTMSPELIENMMLKETQKSIFLVKLASNIKSYIGDMFIVMQKMINHVENGEGEWPVDSSLIIENISVVIESVDSIARVISSPAKKLSKTIKTVETNIMELKMKADIAIEKNPSKNIYYNRNSQDNSLDGSQKSNDYKNINNENNSNNYNSNSPDLSPTVVIRSIIPPEDLQLNLSIDSIGYTPSDSQIRSNSEQYDRKVNRKHSFDDSARDIVTPKSKVRSGDIEIQTDHSGPLISSSYLIDNNNNNSASNSPNKYNKKRQDLGSGNGKRKVKLDNGNDTSSITSISSSANNSYNIHVNHDEEERLRLLQPVPTPLLELDVIGVPTVGAVRVNTPKKIVEQPVMVKKNPRGWVPPVVNIQEIKEKIEEELKAKYEEEFQKKFNLLELKELELDERNSSIDNEVSKIVKEKMKKEVQKLELKMKLKMTSSMKTGELLQFGSNNQPIIDELKNYEYIDSNSIVDESIKKSSIRSSSPNNVRINIPSVQNKVDEHVEEDPDQIYGQLDIDADGPIQIKGKPFTSTKLKKATIPRRLSTPSQVIKQIPALKSTNQTVSNEVPPSPIVDNLSIINPTNISTINDISSKNVSFGKQCDEPQPLQTVKKNRDLIIIGPCKQSTRSTTTDDLPVFLSGGSVYSSSSSSIVISAKVLKKAITPVSPGKYKLANDDDQSVTSTLGTINDESINELPIVSDTGTGGLVTRTYRILPKRDFRQELHDSPNPLLTIYEEYEDLIPKSYQSRFLSAAIDNKSLKKLDVFSRLFIKILPIIDSIEKAIINGLNHMSSSEKMSTILIAYIENNEPFTESKTKSLKHLFRTFGELSALISWAEIQLLEFRIIFERVNTPSITQLPQFLKQCKEFNESYQIFLSCQGKMIGLKNRLENTQLKCSKNNISAYGTTPHYGSDFGDMFYQKDNSNNDNNYNQEKKIEKLLRIIKELKEELVELEEEKEELNMEVFNVMQQKDQTPGSLAFFSTMHDPVTINVLQQLSIQLNGLKDFSEGEQHLEYQVIKNKIQVCLSGLPCLERFIHLYRKLHFQWTQRRLSDFMAKGLTGGDADQILVCPLCCGDTRLYEVEDPAHNPLSVTKPGTPGIKKDIKKKLQKNKELLPYNLFNSQSAPMLPSLERKRTLSAVNFPV